MLKDTLDRKMDRGFTLLEILIGMTLLGVIMGLLFSAFRMGVRSWDAGENRAVETNDVFVVQSFLRSRLMNAQPLVDDLSDDEPEFSFIGTRESLQFISSFSARNGLTKFTVFFDPKDDGSVKITAVPFYPTFEEAESATEIDELVLFDSVEEIEFEYFGSEALDSETDWTSDWEDIDNLPYLVKLDIRFRDKPELAWPSMTVRLRIDGKQS